MEVKMSSNLKNRLIVSGLGIIFLVVVICLSPYGIYKFIFTAITAAIIGMALWELYHISSIKGYQPQRFIGLAITVLYLLALYINSIKPLHHALPEAILGLSLIASFLYYFVKGSNPFVNISITLFGIIYLTVPLSFLAGIDFFSFPFDPSQDGRWWLFYVLAVTKMTDTGAYILGKMYGKKK